MKSKVGLLIKVQLMRVCNPAFFRKSSGGKKRSRILTASVGIVVVGAVLVFYSIMLATAYVKIGAGEVIPRLMTGVCSLLLLFLTLLKGSGALFGSTDFDMVMSLPVKSSQVVVSKLAVLYLVGVLAFAALFLPAFAVYFAAIRPGMAGIFNGILILLVGPVLPLILALTFGTLIAAGTSRLPHRNIFSLVLSIAAVVGIVAGVSVLSTGSTVQIINVGRQISDMIGKICPPAVWGVSLLEGRGARQVILYSFFSLLLAGVFVAAVSRFYIFVNSALASLKRRGAAKAHTGQAASVFKALFRKEFKRLVSCNIYMLNTAIGAVFMVVAGIAVLFFNPGTLEKLVGMPGMGNQIFALLPMILAFMAALSPTTAASLSLEGRNRWIMCALPVRPMEIFHAKMAVNLVITLPAILFAAVCFWIKFRPGMMGTILFFAIPAVYSVFSTVGGADIFLDSLRAPKGAESTCIHKTELILR